MFNCSASDDDFIEAVKNSSSIAQVLVRLNLAPYGGNYNTFHKRVKELNLDTSHFKGQACNKGKSFGPKRPIEDYLSNNQEIKSHSLKKRLISEGFFKHECATCGCSKWFGAKIPLELDHIDGNNKNNGLSNIRLLCPNCHAMTDNYRGKNIKREFKKKVGCVLSRPNKRKCVKNSCLDCGITCSRQSLRCKSCAGVELQRGQTKRPLKEQLLKDKAELRFFTRIGKKYSVSDNAVRKWFVYYNMSFDLE